MLLRSTTGLAAAQAHLENTVLAAHQHIQSHYHIERHIGFVEQTIAKASQNQPL
jgi:hypothetical protein